MIWILAVLVVGLMVYVSQLNRKINTLSQQYNSANTFYYRINALEAVMQHPKFGKFTRIRGAMEGKPFSKWSKEDRQKWHKIARPIIDRSSTIFIRYLPLENVYFAKAKDMEPSIITREHNTGMLYSAYVLGDLEGNEENVELQIYERLVDGAWYLSVCLEYDDGHIISDKRQFQVICNFPLFVDLTDEQYEALGFKVDRHGGDDVYTDRFGKTQSVPVAIDYKNNGVEFSTGY